MEIAGLFLIINELMSNTISESDFNNVTILHQDTVNDRIYKFFEWSSTKGHEYLFLQVWLMCWAPQRYMDGRYPSGCSLATVDCIRLPQ